MTDDSHNVCNGREAEYIIEAGSTGRDDETWNYMIVAVERSRWV